MSKKPQVLIYKPTKNAMQSGYVSKDLWELKYLDTAKVKLDPLMGWSGSNDTRKQIILKFDSRQEAIDYAERNLISITKFDNSSCLFNIIINPCF